MSEGSHTLFCNDHFLIGKFLSYCSFSVFQVLDCVVCLFHIERLLHEVISL